MSTAVILQARMGSTRLPGKVLASIGPWSILEHCVRRLSQSGHRVIVATTTGPEDDAIERAARAMTVDVFRGEATDVLGRYVAAAHACGVTIVVRATADNPLVDGGGVARAIAFQQRASADHVIECGMPVGTAVEAVTVEALERASTLASDPYDREHVTSFIRRDPRFTALRAVAPTAVRRPGLRLTVDTAEDLEFVRAVWASHATGGGIPDLPAVIATADSLIVRAIAQKKVRQGA